MLGSCLKLYGSGTLIASVLNYSKTYNDNKKRVNEDTLKFDEYNFYIHKYNTALYYYRSFLYDLDAESEVNHNRSAYVATLCQCAKFGAVWPYTFYKETSQIYNDHNDLYDQ